jgi:DNA-binding transcriptional MerR regulator
MFKTKKAKLDATPGERVCSSLEVARLAGVTLRQLQWWDEQKVVTPRHHGHRRLYSAADVLEIGVISELRRKGFSLQKIRRVLRFLQREMGKRLEDVLSGASDMHFLTDGRSIYLEDSQYRVIDILKNAKQPMFLVCISDQARRLTLTQRKPARSETDAVASRRGKTAQA